GLLFKDTLYDENAACHIAYGAAYVAGVEDMADLTPDQRYEAGLSVSSVHSDFMIGGPEVEVDGLDAAGDATPLLRDNAWQISVPEPRSRNRAPPGRASARTPPTGPP